jgi:mono/diheme cytochrome c family protein
VEHFADPQAIVAGSFMPTPGLDLAQTTALTTFLLSQQQRDLPGSYLTPEKHLEVFEQARPAPAEGEQLFARFCSTCHDTGLHGRYDKFFARFIPSVRSESFRGSAEPAFIAANIRDGRAGTIMPAWGAAAGGLSEEEIRRLTSWILGRDAAPEGTAARAPIPASPGGNGGRGAALYLKNCSGCHGSGGEGREGPSLNNPVVRLQASDDFLAQTIAEGRWNTAMPAWGGAGGFTDADIRDLIAHIRSLQ